MKYIVAEKLKKSIGNYAEGAHAALNPIDGYADYYKGKIDACEDIQEFITSLQQEQPIEGKQVVIITETDGDANIHWDCRSLDDVKALLANAQSFISDKQVEELRGAGSGPDYNTTEGRFRNAHKFQQEQPECIEKTARISLGLLSNFGTSTYVLDVDLTQDEMAKVAPFGFNSGKIKIKIVCE